MREAYLRVERQDRRWLWDHVHPDEVKRLGWNRKKFDSLFDFFEHSTHGATLGTAEIETTFSNDQSLGTAFIRNGPPGSALAITGERTPDGPRLFLSSALFKSAAYAKYGTDLNLPVNRRHWKAVRLQIENDPQEIANLGIPGIVAYGNAGNPVVTWTMLAAFARDVESDKP